MGATSAAPAISRHECIDSMGLPTSTVGMPVRAAVIGPIVEPHGWSLREREVLRRDADLRAQRRELAGRDARRSRRTGSRST